MARERRVALGYHNEQSDEPGIAQQDDGNFDLIAPDGSRSELGGGTSPFNGGTITEGLTIADPDGTEDQLTITGTGAGTAKLINASAVHTLFTLDCDGNLVYSSDDFPTLRIQGVSTGAALSVKGETATSLEITISDSGIRIIDHNSLAVISKQFQTFQMFAYHAAPADSDLSAGECALWFDQSNGVGNTKLMIKDKSADGTVKTAAVVLT